MKNSSLPLPPTGWRAGWFILGAAMLAQFVLLGWLALSRHGRFESGEDLAMFDQMLWSLRHSHGLITSISGNFSLQFPHHFFGEHVSPILYLLAWPAGLTRGPEALLLMQALVMAVAAWPLYRLTRLWTNSEWLGVGVALGWLLHPALWGAARYDFHMEAFEGWFLFSFALALFRGRWSALLWAALYASCKEDAPIYLAAVAFVLGWQWRQWRIAWPVAGAAFLYALVAVLYLAPAFSPTAQHLLANRLLTPTTCGGVAPWLHTVLLDGPRWRALLWHLLPMVWLPLLGGRLLLPATFAVGVMWLSSADAQAVMGMHYPLTVFPLLALAAVGGAHTLGQLAGQLARPVWRRVLVHGVAWLAVAVLVHVWANDTLLLGEFTRARHALGSADNAAARQLLRTLSDEEPLAVMPTLSAHVARRPQVNLILRAHAGERLLVLLNGMTYPFHEGSYENWLNPLLATNSPYGVQQSAGHRVALLQRGQATTLNAATQRGPRWIPATDYLHHIGNLTADLASLQGEVWEAGRGARDNYALFGYRFDLPPGRYRFAVHLKVSQLEAAHPVLLEVCEDNGQRKVVTQHLERPTRGYAWVELEANLVTGKSVELFCVKTGRSHLWLDGVRYEPLD